MIAIELEIFWLTEEQAARQKSGIPVPDDEITEFKKLTFCNIDYIKPYDKKYCFISCGGETFIAKKSYNEVQAMIRQQLFFKMN